MNVEFDAYNQPIKLNLYLASPNKKILCGFDNIDESTFSLTENLNNTWELSFDINRYVLLTRVSDKASNSIGGYISDEEHRFIVDDNNNYIAYPETIDDTENIEIESLAYKLVDSKMRIFIDRIGWFIMDTPTEDNDGIKQTKSITAQSAEIEFQQHDLKNFKVNQGTTDSYEMLADDNVDEVDGVEFAKEQIKFYNPDNPQLSLLDVGMKAAGLIGWSVGEIDPVPKTYRNYVDGKYVEKQVLLSDEIGSFDIESEDLYTFFTQELSKYYECIFVFDIRRMKVNAYRPENYGRDTNINVGFKSVQKSNEVTVDEDSIFTRYYVQGADDLGIEYVNFGNNWIEDLSYYLNEKYMTYTLIQKYKLWESDLESRRLSYIEDTRLYNKQLSVISELYDRVPLDDCSTDWSTFSDDELKESQANYQAQLKGYEQFYVDKDGNFDEEALKNSSDANDYYQIKNVILPSIQIEMDNRELPTDDDNADYVDSYKTDWKLYGLDELQTKLDSYQDIIDLCKKSGYDKPYSDDSSHTEDVHTKMYEQYLDAVNQLDPDYIGGCREAYDQRKQEIDDATAIRDEYNTDRKEIAKSVDKETWTHPLLNGNYYITDENNNSILDEKGNILVYDVDNLMFDQDELEQLSRLYTDSDYENTNMFIVSSDDAVTTIDEQLKLLQAAQDDLYISAHPQYQFTTELDNFLALYGYEDYAKNLKIGDYIWLETKDDNVVKLRIISIEYNPLEMNGDIKVTFSNMVDSRSGRDDHAYLLGVSSGGSKKSSSGSSDSFSQEAITQLTSGILQKLLTNSAFTNRVTQITNGQIVSGLGTGGSVSVSEINAKIIKATDIYGENGYFGYIQAKLISTDKIVANSGTFGDLTADVANIKSAIIGTSATETGIIINLTSENATIDEALIKELVAKYITVNDLKAGNINTSKFTVSSENGTFLIKDNTLIIYDENENPVIQLGEDKNGNYGLVISDSNGAILLDSEGLHEGIVPDNFVKTDMLDDKSVTEEKIDRTNMVEWTDDDGNKIFDVSRMYFGSDKFITSYKSIEENVSTTKDGIETINNTLDIMNSGYTILMLNDSQNIPCNKDGNTSYSFLIEIPFRGYLGVDKVACTATSVENLPEGITLAENTPSTETEDGKIILNVAKGLSFGNTEVNEGKIVIRFELEGQTLTKRFAWNKTFEKSTDDVNNTTLYSIEASEKTLLRYSLDLMYLGDENGNFIVDEKGSSIYGTAEVETTPEITFKAYKQVDGKEKEPYSGRFVIQESKNGVSYASKYMSDEDESSVTYTLTTSALNSIKCILYEAGSIKKQIDFQTVPVLDDNASLENLIRTYRDTFKSVSLQIDNVNKSISQNAWQKDIEDKINDYDGSTIQIIRDLQTDHTVKIGEISSRVSKTETQIEKSDEERQTLKSEVSEFKQTYEGFKQDVERNYVTNDGVTEVVNSSMKQTADGILEEVSKKYGTKEELAEIKKTADSITSTVSSLKIGGNNLLTNSNCLIYNDYVFL